MEAFKEKVERLFQRHEELITRKNVAVEDGNGIFTRYKYPVVTAAHTPVFWRYDLDEKSNPYLMERIGMNATMNSGAIKWNGKYLMVVRVEGADRKSFFAVAESPNGIDNFRFWDYPITMPEDAIPATNVYDMRLTAHEDGWIYGIFCAERHDDNAPAGDLSSATATAAIARTKDLKNWERLPDLKTKSQQRNVVLHPEFVDGKYALYTRPQDGFIDAGSGGGIGMAGRLHAHRRYARHDHGYGQIQAAGILEIYGAHVFDPHYRAERGGGCDFPDVAGCFVAAGSPSPRQVFPA